MKTHTLPMAAMGIALLLCACDHDAEVALRPSVASFSLETVSFSEADNAQDVVIELSKPATDDGSVTVGVESEALEHFTIIPLPQNGVITVEIPKGSSRAVISIKATDNHALDGTKLVNFTLREATRGLQIGPKSRMSSTWIDDESPARISFAAEQGAMLESSSTSSVVTLTLSHAVPGDGTIEINFANGRAIYGTDFTTHPEAVNNTLVLSVSAGEATVSFVVDPLNDALFNADRTVTFTINAVSPVLEKGGRLSHGCNLRPCFFDVGIVELESHRAKYLTHHVVCTF